MASFALLLKNHFITNAKFFCNLFYCNLFYHNLFQSFFHHNLFQSFLFYHNLFESYYKLQHYLYENKLMYKFHHVAHIFYCQSMTKIICQYHMLFTLNSFHFVSNNFFIKKNIFEFVKLSCNAYSFCCITFFTISFFFLQNTFLTLIRLQ